MTRGFEAPYDLGGTLNGIDIAPDDSYLLVAQGATGLVESRFERLNPATGDTQKIYYSSGFLAAELSWDVSIGGFGKALVTTKTSTTSATPLRQIDLASGTISARQDAPGSGANGQVPFADLHRSADRSAIYVAERYDSRGTIFGYAAASDTFTAPVQTMDPNSGLAINRNGSIAAVRHATTSLNSLPDLRSLHTLLGTNYSSTFDATRDVVYAVNIGADELVGFNTTTFADELHLPLGEHITASSFPVRFGPGTFVASPNSRYLALISPTALRIFDLQGNNSASITLAPHVANISTRASVGVGDNVPIAGFIVNGTQPKKVLIRAVGPSLATARVVNALSDPTLELHDSAGVAIALNDNWSDSQRSAIEATGIPPTSDAEAAIIAELAPGSYTAVMRGRGDSTGVGVIEVYDLDSKADANLANISTRGVVGTGDDVMIAGVIMQGAPSNSCAFGRDVAVRGIGPSLGNQGVPNPLQDPMVQIFDASGSPVATNYDWQMTDNATVAKIQSLHLAPYDRREAVVLATLPTGNYTAVLRGQDGGSGVGLIEMYSLQ